MSTKKKTDPKQPVKPAAKAAPKTSSKPSKPAAKPAAKPAPKKVAAKPAPSKASPKSAAKPVAKTAPAKASTPKAVSSKAVPKIAAKPAAKAAAKPVAKVAPKAPAAKVVAPKAESKAAKAALKASPPPKALVAAKAVSEKEVVVKPVAEAVAPSVDKRKGSPVVVAESPVKDVAAEEPSILGAGRKLLKTAFFLEVDESEERANKKKYSSELKMPEKPTSSSRRKALSAEESPEELIERLAQELEDEFMGSQRETDSQICTKCGINMVCADFRVDKDLGYCEECAEMLRLGETKEARKVDYQMSLLRKDALGEGVIPAGPRPEGDEADEEVELEDEDLDDDI